MLLVMSYLIYPIKCNFSTESYEGFAVEGGFDGLKGREALFSACVEGRAGCGVEVGATLGAYGAGRATEQSVGKSGRLCPGSERAYPVDADTYQG